MGGARFRFRRNRHRHRAGRSREIRGRASFVIPRRRRSSIGSASTTTARMSLRSGWRRLRDERGWPRIPIGINIGKSKATPLEDAVEDYLYSFRRLREFADYIVLNVSSPNTPGLRDLQQEEALMKLLRAIRAENQGARKPVLLKDRTRSRTARPRRDHRGLRSKMRLPESSPPTPRSITPRFRRRADQAGGLSGRPLREKSTAFVRLIRERSQASDHRRRRN